MEKRTRYWILILLVLCSPGCLGTSKPEAPTNPKSVRPEPETAIQIETGFYPEGPEYDRVTKLLANSDASVSLDAHQGIQWHNSADNRWAKIKHIDDLKALLESTEPKRLLRISTGKAMWDKEEQYIATLTKHAGELGFKKTVVTAANARGLVVSEVFHHAK